MNAEMTMFVIIAGCLSVAMLATIAFTVERMAKRLDQIVSEIRRVNNSN